jgi:hypothetical protein
MGQLFAGAGESLSGYALQTPARAFLTLIDALFSSCLTRDTWR